MTTDASGAVEVRVVRECLDRSTLGRGSLFLPPIPVENKGAKLRRSALSSLMRWMRRGCHIAVVWRYDGSRKYRLWEGDVMGNFEDTDCFSVKYHQRADLVFPFPPISARVIICAVRMRSAPSRRKRRWRRCATKSTSPGEHVDRALKNQNGSAVKEKLSIATLNVTSLKLEGGDLFSIRSCVRLKEILNLMSSKRIHILGLQETRFRFDSRLFGEILRQQTEDTGVTYYLYFSSATSDRSYNGMALVSTFPLEKVRVISERIMTAQFPWENGNATLFNVYGPIRDSSKEMKSTFDASLRKAVRDLESTNPQRPTILIGDFNSPLTLVNKTAEDKAAVARFRALLVDVGCKSAHTLSPSSRKWTCKLPNGAERQLDHIIISNRYASAIQHHKVLLAPFPTQHCSVVTRLKIKWKAHETQPGNHLPWYNLKSENICKEFNKCTQQAVFKVIGEGRPDPWEVLSEGILYAAQKTLPDFEAPSDLSKSNGQREETNKQEEILSLSALYKSSRNAHTFKGLVDKSREKIEDTIEAECAILQEKLRKNHSSPWRFIREICGMRKTVFNYGAGQSNRKRLAAVKDFFSKIANRGVGDTKVEFDEAKNFEGEIMDSPFTEDELACAARRLKRGKAPGLDEIPAEAYISILEENSLRHLLLGIINKALETGKTHHLWKTVLQVPVPKKGDLSELRNWRPICLVNVILKLINGMILNRIRPSTERVLRENQYGFRPERSTCGAQIILNEILTKSRRNRSHENVMIAFIDFASAFPSLSHSSIRAALHSFHVGPRMTTLAMSAYEGLEAIVRTPFGKTSSFPITSGILQGDVLAPYLFIMVLDRILHAALKNKDDGLTLSSAGTRKRGYKSTRVTDIDYADDLILFSDSKRSLERMVDSVATEASKANLSIAAGVNKTAWMSISKNENKDGDLLSSTCGNIPKVKSYRHLGHVQHETEPKLTLTDRLRLTWACFSKLRGIWISPLRVKAKLRIFDTLVYPILNYGTSSMVISASQVRNVEVQVNNMRRIVCDAVGVDENGHCYPIESLYHNTLHFNTIHRINRARLVGHQIRHSEIYRSLVGWGSREKARFPSPSESCAQDLGIEMEEMLVYASDRAHWAKLIENLSERLEPSESYIGYKSPKWKLAYKNALKETVCNKLQFIEEGETPFPVKPEEMHAYVDASISDDTDTRVKVAVGCVIVNAEKHESFSSSLSYLETKSPERAEIHAALFGLSKLKEVENVVVHTDSYYVWNFVNMRRRKDRLVGFEGSNSDLLSFLDSFIRSAHCQGRTITFIKVRGHCGNKWNEEADTLSKKLVSSEPISKRRKNLNRGNESAHSEYEWIACLKTIEKKTTNPTREERRMRRKRKGKLLDTASSLANAEFEQSEKKHFRTSNL